jgi:hypothetical protein
MARELNDLYGDALVEIGATGPDRVVSAEDMAELARIYGSLWPLLDEMGLVYWEIDGAVPDAAALPMAWVLAYHAAQPFGVSGDRLERLRINGQVGGQAPSQGERLLRKLAAAKYIAEPMAVEDF